MIAHELSHVAHRDVADHDDGELLRDGRRVHHPLGLLLRGSSAAASAAAATTTTTPATSFIVVLLVSIVVYALSFVLIRTLSRYREFAADRGAAILTKSPSSLASALVEDHRRDGPRSRSATCAWPRA